MSNPGLTWSGLNSPRELTEDVSRPWRLRPFQPSGAVEVEHDRSRLVRKAQPTESPTTTDEPEWDHEHCEGCWAKISLAPGDHQAAYTDGEYWVCPSCFKAHIEPLLVHNQPPTLQG